MAPLDPNADTNLLVHRLGRVAGQCREVTDANVFERVVLHATSTEMSLVLESGGAFAASRYLQDAARRVVVKRGKSVRVASPNVARPVARCRDSTRFKATRHHGHRPGSAHPARNATGQENPSRALSARGNARRGRPLPYTDKGASMSGRESLALIRRPIANRGSTGCRLHCAQRAISRNRYREVILSQLNVYHHPISDTNLRGLIGEVRAAGFRRPEPTTHDGRDALHSASLFSSGARTSP